MNTTSTCTSFVTVLAGAATLALLLVGTGTAHALPGDCGGFGVTRVQPGPDACPDNSIEVGNPDERRTLGIEPGSSIGLGGPDTVPPQHN